jgi:acyl carrier protein
MSRLVFIQRLNELMSLPVGTIKGHEQLDSIKNWDSVALMSFIAFLNEEFEIRVNGKQVMQCQNIEDLVLLAGDKVTP